MQLLEDSQFVVALVVTQAILGFLNSATLAIQAKTCDLAETYKDITAAKKCIQDKRTDDSWEKVWSRIEVLASSIDLTIVKPRTATIQMHRTNAGRVNQTTSDYYRMNLYYPFIDHVMEQLEPRFSNEYHQIIAANYLIPPQNLRKLSDDKIAMILSYYGNLMITEEKSIFSIEVAKWKKTYSSIPVKQRPDSAVGALSECSGQSFPALNKVLTVYFTIPVGSESCERSFSALCRLKLWTCSAMTEHRLSRLAMMLLHRDNPEFIPSPEEICERKLNWRHLR